MAQRQGRVVAWVTGDEWVDVQTWLYAQDEASRKRGVERVSAWRARSKLPVAVDATATIVDVQLKDELLCRQRGMLQESFDGVLRLAYASAITRFVNGMVDQLQKGAYAKSVSSIAQTLGLPPWLVDIRHEATHSKLPALPLCRIAANEALAWLRTNYWDRQSDPQPDPTRKDMTSMLNTYIQAQEKILEAEAAGVKVKKGAVKAAMQGIGEACQGMAGREDTVAALVAWGGLAKDGRHLAPSIGPIAHVCPPSHALWSPLISYLAKNAPGIFPNLATALATALVDDAEDAKKNGNREGHLNTLVSWMLHILSSYPSDEMTRCQPEIRTLLLDNPTPAALALLPHVISDLSEDAQQRVQQLAALHHAAMQNVEGAAEVPEADMWALVGTEEAPPPLPGRTYQRIPGAQWLLCAVGSLPANPHPSLSLPASLDTLMYARAATGQANNIATVPTQKRPSSPTPAETAVTGEGTNKRSKTENGPTWSGLVVMSLL